MLDSAAVSPVVAGHFGNGSGACDIAPLRAADAFDMALDVFHSIWHGSRTGAIAHARRGSREFDCRFGIAILLPGECVGAKAKHRRHGSTHWRHSAQIEAYLCICFRIACLYSNISSGHGMCCPHRRRGFDRHRIVRATRAADADLPRRGRGLRSRVGLPVPLSLAAMHRRICDSCPHPTSRATQHSPQKRATAMQARSQSCLPVSSLDGVGWRVCLGSMESVGRAHALTSTRSPTGARRRNMTRQEIVSGLSSRSSCSIPLALRKGIA